MSDTVERTHLSPPKMAAQRGSSVKTIHALILSGELQAIDMSTPGSERPRYLIPLEAIADFDRRRRVVPSTDESSAPRHRRKARPGVKEFF